MKIDATDVGEEALRTGRHGIYSAKALADAPAELREKYFERFDNRYALRRDLRRAVIFGRHNRDGEVILMATSERA